MAKGGARTRSGPAPVLDDGEWLTLPREGRPGLPPEWPLSEPSERERELWLRQWRRPQALAWERHGLDENVALYVRALARAEADGAPTAAVAEVRRLQDSLGLSVPGMRANRWRIALLGGEQVEQPDRPAEPPRPAAGVSPRERLKVVGDGRGT